MDIQLKYKDAMEEYDLQKSDLPKDAKIGISEIDKILKALKMLEKTGKTAKPATMDKLASLDKWVYYEILDHVHDTDENEEEKPVEAEEVIEEMKENAEEQKEELSDEVKLGNKINEELEALHKSGKSEWTIDEIKSKAKNAYEAIWDAYEDGGDNGVQTPNYSLIEGENEIFTIKQR